MRTEDTVLFLEIILPMVLVPVEIEAYKLFQPILLIPEYILYKMLN